MAAKTFPNLGLKGGYDIGEAGWGDDMSANLLKLSILTQGGVLGIVADYPASPANGDIYINSTTNKIGARVEGAWTEYTPAEGWLVYDRDQDAYVTFSGTAWAALETGGGSGGGIPDAPSDGSLYARKNGAWEGFTPGSGGGGSDATFQPPSPSAFPVLLNASGPAAFFTETDDGTTFSLPTTGNGVHISAALASIPATDWSIVGKFSAITWGTTPAGGGLMVRNSANSRMVSFQFQRDKFEINRWNSVTAFNANRLAEERFFENPYFMIARVGLALKFSLSKDKTNWIEIFTEGIDAYLIDINQAGLMLHNESDKPVHLLCDYYKKTV